VKSNTESTTKCPEFVQKMRLISILFASAACRPMGGDHASPVFFWISEGFAAPQFGVRELARGCPKGVERPHPPYQVSFAIATIDVASPWADPGIQKIPAK
jgi:hypothetical protein